MKYTNSISIKSFFLILLIIFINKYISNDVDISFKDSDSLQPKQLDNLILKGGAVYNLYSIDNISKFKCSFNNLFILNKLDNRYNIPYDLYYNEITIDKLIKSNSNSLPGVAYKPEFYMTLKNEYITMSNSGKSINPVNYFYDSKYMYQSKSNPYDFKVIFNNSKAKYLCDKGISLFQFNIIKEFNYKDLTKNINSLKRGLITLKNKVNLIYGWHISLDFLSINLSAVKEKDLIDIDDENISSVYFKHYNAKYYKTFIVLHNSLEYINNFDKYNVDNKYEIINNYSDQINSNIIDDIQYNSLKFPNNSIIIEFEFNYDPFIFQFYTSSDNNKYLDKHIKIHIYNYKYNYILNKDNNTYKLDIDNPIKIYFVKNKRINISNIDINLAYKIKVYYKRLDNKVDNECNNHYDYSIGNIYNKDNKSKEYYSNIVDSLIIQYDDLIISCMLINIASFITLDTVFDVNPNTGIKDRSQAGLGYISIIGELNKDYLRLAQVIKDSSLENTKKSKFNYIELKELLNHENTITEDFGDYNNQLLILRSLSFTSYKNNILNKQDFLNEANKSDISSISLLRFTKEGYYIIRCGIGISALEKESYLKEDTLSNSNGYIKVRNISSSYSEKIKFVYKSSNDYKTYNVKELNNKDNSCIPNNYYLYPNRISNYLEDNAVIIEYPLKGYSPDLNAYLEIYVVNNYGKKVPFNHIISLNNYLERNFKDELYDICVNSNNNVLELGYCDCRICERILDIQKAYATFDYHSLCIDKFSFFCNCFDISKLTKDSTLLQDNSYPNSNIDNNMYYNTNSNNIKFLRINICTACKYDSHCKSNIKNSTCDLNQKKSIYNLDLNNIYLGNPLSKTIELEDFIDFSRDNNRVSNGLIKFSNCICTNYCDNNISQLDNISFDINEYSVYVLNNNLNSAISFDFKKCYNCLTNFYKTEESCNFEYCSKFEVKGINYYTYPFGGIQCNRCFFSGEFFQALNKIDKLKGQEIIDCINKKNFNNPIKNCDKVTKSLGYEESLLFSGVITHYRVECPNNQNSINNINNNIICVPWLGVKNNSNVNNIIKKVNFDIESSYNTIPQWNSVFECVNSMCLPSTEKDCFSNNEKCICHNYCPVGKSQDFNYHYSGYSSRSEINTDIFVPCSGRGYCTYKRLCICDFGYYGHNCSKHCSSVGCCKTDNDCLFKNKSLEYKCVFENERYEIGYCSI